VFQLFTVRGGLVTRREDFLERSQALHAAGLPSEKWRRAHRASRPTNGSAVRAPINGVGRRPQTRDALFCLAQTSSGSVALPDCRRSSKWAASVVVSRRNRCHAGYVC